jgi:putative ABC transport system ATP-binding protein
MCPEALAELRGVSKEYSLDGSAVKVLQKVNFTVYPGEFIAITGASGSGKSTLLHICGCLDRPSSGSYFLGGRDVSHLSDTDLAALRGNHIGFVFQDFNLLPYATVYENIALPFVYSTIEREQWHVKVMQALCEVGLEHRQNHRPSALSGGERQRVAIARALVRKPQLILADEPTGNLDSATGTEIMALFSRLHKGGASILLVTHDAQVAGIAARQVHMQDGRLEGSI